MLNGSTSNLFSNKKICLANKKIITIGDLQLLDKNIHQHFIFVKSNGRGRSQINIMITKFMLNFFT